jgi:hypothetical protein
VHGHEAHPAERGRLVGEGDRRLTGRRPVDADHHRQPGLVGRIPPADNHHRAGGVRGQRDRHRPGQQALHLAQTAVADDDDQRPLGLVAEHCDRITRDELRLHLDAGSLPTGHRGGIGQRAAGPFGQHLLVSLHQLPAEYPVRLAVDRRHQPQRHTAAGRL